MTIALTKTLDPERDYPELALELMIVDRHFHAAAPQHEHRRWEYAMALRAQDEWRKRGWRPHRVYDVGGAGSPFRHMVDCEDRLYNIRVIDPAEPSPNDARLEDVIHSARLADNVFCLSVIEHVDDFDRFLYHLACLVAPGGLLFLTMDACDQFVDDWPEDRYHFHWMRKRIFNRYGWQLGVQEVLTHQHAFQAFGAVDWSYHGDHVYDYTFASLALIKRP